MSELVTQAEGAKRLGISPQSIGMWAAKAGAPASTKKGKRMLSWPDFPRWREELLVRSKLDAVKRLRPESEDEARKRKLLAEAVLAELAVEEKEDNLLAKQVVDDAFGEVGNRLRSVLVNVASNYGIDLERAGVDPATAQRVLEKIADDLTGCLRNSISDMDADGDD